MKLLLSGPSIISSQAFDFPGNIISLLPKKNPNQISRYISSPSQTDINHRRQLMIGMARGLVTLYNLYPMPCSVSIWKTRQQIDSFRLEFPDRHLSSHPVKRVSSRGTPSIWYHYVRQRYGLPLDSRHLYTKTDWEFFAMAVASKSVRSEIVESVATWINCRF
jgi:Domain of unknown function (DUF1793)